MDMRHVAAAAVLVITLAGSAVGDDLYKSSSFFTGLFADRKAAAVGDVLHVLITESASATQQAARVHNKDSDTTSGPGTGWLDFIPLLGYGAKSKYNAGATATRSGTISARLTVAVKEVLANGNLVVEGHRRVQVNKDLQDIVMRGEVRRRDISRNNTVYSYQVANVEIEYTGSDPRKPGSKVGLISRIINLLF